MKKNWCDDYFVNGWKFDTCNFLIKTTTSNIKITCPVINQLNQKINNLRAKLGNSIFEKYHKFLINLAKEQDIFNTIIQYISNIDWYISCAKNAYDYQYYMPIISDKFEGKSYLQAQQIRHPIIERILKYENYVPNDIELGTDKQLGILLYGVNSAGKSSISKAIALNIIMAQSGMYVPSKLEYYPYNEIFTRIPSGDNEMQGKSTFIVEMSEFRNIIQRATPHSLVIGDEVCSGTESISALSLVGSGICQLCNLGVSFIFATHLHNLTNISFIKELVENSKLSICHLSVRYDAVNDCLRYDRTIQSGQGETIYGLEVAKSLDLGVDFLNLANKIRHEILENSVDLCNKKKSQYNANLYIDMCALCKKKADEVHHIQPQMLADKKGFIGDIHKNKLANLIPICESCHDKIHSGKIKLDGFKQTTKGIELIYELTAKYTGNT
jgi:DNA mismatch repair protein MutS